MAALNILSYVQLGRLVNPTGVGRVAGCLLRGLLASSDFQLRLLVSGDDLRLFLPYVPEGVRCLPFPRRRRFQEARWAAFHFPLAEHYWSDCRVVWCPAESYVPTRRARLLVTAHDLAWLHSAAVRGRRISSFEYLKWRWLYRIFERRADALHVVSAFIAHEVSVRFPALASRVHVVPNPVDERFFLPSALDAGAVLRKRSLNREFVFVPGGLWYRKNAPLIVAAWPLIKAKLPDTQLVVGGTSDPLWIEKLQAVDRSASALGYLDDEELRALYGAARAVWFPSRYEGFGIPVVEAMACGVPVVASHAAAVPEVAGQAAVLLSPDDAGSHAEAIVSLCSSASLREDYAGRGRARAEEFRRDRVVGKFGALLRSIA
jgi:glycosyltransferase involved in cell wall biosynthesis